MVIPKYHLILWCDYSDKSQAYIAFWAQCTHDQNVTIVILHKVRHLLWNGLPIPLSGRDCLP